jgi:hypothetical protein
VVQGQPWAKNLRGNPLCPSITTNSWTQCCTDVIPAMREAEIGRITIPNQPEQKSAQNPISTEKTGHGGAHVSSQLQKEVCNGIAVQASVGKNRDSKTNQNTCIQKYLQNNGYSDQISTSINFRFVYLSVCKENEFWLMLCKLKYLEGSMLMSIIYYEMHPKYMQNSKKLISEKFNNPIKK